MEKLLSSLPNNPLVAFTIFLLAILILPPIFEKIRLPGLVGLLFAGVVLGENGLHWLDKNSESIKLFSDIGKIYLMFVAGLEIDLVEFRKTKNRSLAFGMATFIIPLVLGTIVGRSFDFSWNSSILIGSLFASHTLLAYPIVQRLGVVRNEAITITIGATIFTDIAALLVLAVCVSIHQGEFSSTSLAIQLIALAIYTVAVLFGLDWAGKEYFRRTGDEQGNQFLFVLVAVFLASVGAQIINVDKIVGAFLAGLAVNDVVGEGPVKEKVEFVGSTLFIPFFFVGMGLLLDIPTFMETVRFQLPLVLGIVAGLIVAKFLAAIGVKFLYRYNWNEGLTMWSLSLPQVAATLAAALVAYQARNSAGQTLISVAVFNSIIVLMLVTSILGPLLTARFARNLSVPTIKIEPEVEVAPTIGPSQLEAVPRGGKFTVVVSMYNPQTQRYLMEMAALLARHEAGTIVPLSIATAHVHMDDPQLNDNLRTSWQLLDRALSLARTYGVEVRPSVRIDEDIAQGISRAAREKNASLIVMGWSRTTGLRARFFGSIIDSVFWSSHCPVAVMRLLEEPAKLHRLLVPVKTITPQSLQAIQFAQLFADANQGVVTLLHVCDRRILPAQVATFREDLLQVVSETGLSVKCQVKIVPHEDVAKVIIRASHAFDLVILRSVRRRTAGGLAVSDVTTQVIEKLTCSLVLFGEPHS